MSRAVISRVAPVGTFVGLTASLTEAIAMPKELEPLTEQEQRVVALLRHARETERAPAGLRARIEAQRPSRRTQTRRRVGYGGALAGALAAGATVLALTLPGGTPGAPSVSQAAQLGLLGPTAAAPTPDPTEPAKLQTSVGELYFPNWKSIHWLASGQRSDRIKGRSATTVYYDWHGQRVAYTIVDVPVLKLPNAATSTVHGTTLQTLAMNGRTVVTWRVANHTCVLSASGVSASELQELASWRGPAGVG